MSELEFQNLGAVPSPYDYRQIPLSMVATAVPLPETYRTDISALTVFNQKKLGACVGHAFAKACQYYWFRKTGKVVNFSPRFLYAMAKAQDGIADEGTNPAIVAKILQKYGCATENTVPNNTDLSHEEYVYNRIQANIPGQDEALQYRIPGYAFLNTKNPDEIKRAIFDGGVFAGLVQVGKEWWTDVNGIVTWDKDKILPLRPPQTVISGHEVLFYGWDNDIFYDLSNSWSTAWADNGNGDFNSAAYAPFFVEGIVIKELPPAVVDEVKKLPSKPKHTFLVDMAYGQTSDEVVNLQQCLKYEGLFPVATPCTGYYGEVTRQGVLAFQRKYELINNIEAILYRGKYAYIRTRNKLNELFS